MTSFEGANAQMVKALHDHTHVRMDETARVPCACCGDEISKPIGKKRTDILVCGCPSHPLICGPCRNRKFCCKCSWCGQDGFVQSIRSRQQACEINLLAKRWESFRTDHPDILSPLAENWCFFVRYYQARQTIEETIQGFAKMFGFFTRA
jgi:hypothetical protein